MARDRASRPEARSLRLFVAIELPTSAVGAVERAVAAWRDRLDARWVPPENWHVTVKFLGQVWPRLRTWIEGRVEEAAGSCPAFDTVLTGLGTFPDPRRARVVWAGLDDGSGHMADVARALDRALSREFRPETRAFTPHVTVARSQPPIRVPPELATTPVEPTAFRVERLVLFRSHLRRPAPLYEPVAAFPLGR